MRNSPSTSPLRGLACGEGLWVIVGSDTTILTSRNGSDWTAQSAGMTAPTLYCVAYGNGRYVAGGGEGALIRSSPDGLHWADGLSTIGTERILGLTHSDGLFVGAGTSAHGQGYILTSSDGLAWTPQTVPTTNSLLAVTAAEPGNLFVAAGEAGTIITSTDGQIWLPQNSGVAVALRAVVFYQNRFIVGGDSGTVLVSSNGVAWQAVAPTSFNVRGLACSAEAVVAVGNYMNLGRLHVSSDGLSWPGNSLEFNQPLNGIAYASGSFVAAGDRGLTLQSGTGTVLVNQWTNTTSGYWEQPFWSLGVLPGSSQTVQIVNSGWKAVAIGSSTVQNAPESLTVGKLDISAPAGSRSLLLLNHAWTNVSLRVLEGMSVGPGGGVMSLCSGLVVGSGLSLTNSEMDQEGGLVSISGGLKLGGTYNLTNGTVHADRLVVGTDFDGAFNQFGGTTIADTVLVGGIVAPPFIPGAVYHLVDGTLTAAMIQVGGGTSFVHFEQDGGVTEVAQLRILSLSSAARYQLNGGTLNAGTTELLSGFQGSLFTQTGGEHILTNELRLEGGIRQGALVQPSRYVLTGGHLSSPLLRLANYSQFSQTNGTTLAQTVSIETTNAFQRLTSYLAGGMLGCGNLRSGGIGADLLQTGGSLVVSNLLSYNGLGPYNGSNALLALTGGSLYASNIEISATLVLAWGGSRVQNPGYCKLSGLLVAADANEHLGRFILPANATIDLAGTTNRLAFAASSTESWAPGARLSILGWYSTAAGGGLDQLYFGSTAQDLTASQLAQIRFVDPVGWPQGNYPARILATGEVVPGTSPILDVAANSGQLILSWNGDYQLLTATNVLGPYVPIPGSQSPITNAFVDPQRYFRLGPP